MTIQVLIATMHQTDHSLLEKMNIQSDAIVGNQCDRNFIEDFEYNGNKIRYLSFKERGVGLNRNNALMRANADICVLADDDMIYVNNYSQVVQEEFNKHPDADVLIFNIAETVPTRYIIKSEFNVNYLNFMRFGAVRIAFRTKSIKKCGISFNLNFGGGTERSFGEDTLFLHSCLRNKLKIVAIPVTIAKLLDDRESSWFKGYNEKYFIDKGYLFRTMTGSNTKAKLLSLQDAVRHRKLYTVFGNWRRVYAIMCKGIKQF